MMKKSYKKKFAAALAMMMVSVVTLSTATYAWFSMNTQVTATGMKVTAKSDTLFFEIKGTEDTEYSKTGTNAVEEELNPTHHETLTSLSDIVTEGNWYYRYNRNHEHATNSMTDKVVLTDFDGYVVKTEYEVRLNEFSGQETAYDLYVSSINITKDKGITVIIAGQDGFVELSADDNGEITFDKENSIISNTVTKTEQTISVYIYFNGDDENVYSDNIEALEGEVEFTLDVFVTDN